MMILRTSPASPFGRQVKLAIGLLRLSQRIKTKEADPTDPHDTLRQQNPLGKIPVLILEDGTALYDSRVILEYLDDIAEEAQLIPPGKERFPALTLHALANGITDAAVMNVYEKRFRSVEQQSEERMAYQADKITRGLESLEAETPELKSAKDIHLGHVSLACALGYLDLRFDGKWRANYPALVSWLDRFCGFTPEFQKTKIEP